MLRNYLRVIIPLFLGVLLPVSSAFGQADLPEYKRLLASETSTLAKLAPTTLLLPADAPASLQQKITDEVEQAAYFRTNPAAVSELLTTPPERLRLQVPTVDGEILELSLVKSRVFSHDFQAFLASDPTQPFPYQQGSFYWGIVDGRTETTAAISITNSEVAGLVSLDGITYNLGRLEGKDQDLHVLYRAEDLKSPPVKECDTDDVADLVGKDPLSPVVNLEKGADNCVRMYVEVDYDITVGKGGPTQAGDYVSAVFTQVAIMYANEAIDFTVSEMKVWDVADPYEGPTTRDFLYAFRDNLNGSYNGDLAHLVGYQGGGGVAYVNVICNDVYGVGYSDINSSFNEVPTYSWTIEVVTHEIGHNLGSQHTHACAWGPNGNTAIDGCGPAAGYSEGCDGPVPNKGTVMSYCHLVSGVGIDLALGFGPEPQARIQSRVYNASCLSACGPAAANDAAITGITAPVGTDCETNISPVVNLQNQGTASLSSVNVSYRIDGGTAVDFNWTGSLASGATTSVTLPASAVGLGSHTLDVSSSNPNGSADEVPGNDSQSGTFTVQSPGTYYADVDGDGFGDPNSAVTSCGLPNGYVSDNTDCDDTDEAAYPGAPCSTGDACVTGETLDANCNCGGGTVSADGDGDGVCDAQDVCPGGDDTLDADGDGIPDFCDCNADTGSFPVGQLVTNGSNSASTTFDFPAGSKDASFTISGLDARLSGNPRNRYEESVAVSYVDGNGNTQSGGTYGNGQGSANVSLSGPIQSVTLTLSDGYDGSAPQTISVSLGAIDFCKPFVNCASGDDDGDGVCNDVDACPGFNNALIGTSCDDLDDCTTDDVWTANCECAGTPSGDDDGDGVCNALDVCPGFDDTIDSDGDGIPDGCDTGNCNEVTANFGSSPLTHAGGGSSSTAVNFSGVHTDASFTVNDLNARTNGRQDRRFEEVLTVTYVDGADNTVTYGTFSGATVSSVSVSIPGIVKSIQLSLSDNFSNGTSLSVSPSSVTTCGPASLPGTGLTQTATPAALTLYPNPTANQAVLSLGAYRGEATVVVRNLLGAEVRRYRVTELPTLTLNVRDWKAAAQVYLITVYRDNERPVTLRLVAK